MNHRYLIKAVVSCVLLTTVISHFSWSEPGLEGRKQVVLAGSAAQVSVDVAGGSIVDFHLIGDELNPLRWNYPEKIDLKPRTMGHFICFDRWGQPSKQEGENGMPFHGEASFVEWQVLSKPLKKDGAIIAEMSCELPIGGMKLTRTLSLYEHAPVLIVREEITNLNKLGRLYNIVQHSTIGPPFLDKSVIVDSNVYKGFMQESPMPTPEEPLIYWPGIVYKGELVDLRCLNDNPMPTVVSYVFEDGVEYGWVTACNSKKGLMIGYIWKVSDYPWLNFWRHVTDGKPSARGLEFGTTGLHKPFGDLVAKGEIFNRRLYEYLDAGQTVEKSYVAFLSEIPHGYKGVREVVYEDKKIIIKELDSDETKNITIKQ